MCTSEEKKIDDRGHRKERSDTKTLGHRNHFLFQTAQLPHQFFVAAYFNEKSVTMTYYVVLSIHINQMTLAWSTFSSALPFTSCFLFYRKREVQLALNMVSKLSSYSLANKEAFTQKMQAETVELSGDTKSKGRTGTKSRRYAVLWIWGREGEWMGEREDREMRRGGRFELRRFPCYALTILIP